MQKSHQMTQIIRWIARVLSLGAIVLMLLFLAGEGGLSEITFAERILLFFFPTGVMVGLMVAWWRERLGVGVALGSLVAFYVIHLAMGEGFPSGPFFLLFASPAFLFLLCAWMDRERIETPPAG
jgi:hypothetical protein